ncbi:MAG TPA: N-acetylmuramoyl-L-alanine amidase [Vicinamibacterales bacterium]|nr:N-acetylmuramoyl-L-alanine amidase [Vicinamibacterales bacterium]
MIRAAVQENADVIAGRLPAPLRPTRRLLNAWRQRAWLLAVPLVVLAWIPLAHRTDAVQPPRPAAPQAPALAAGIVAPSRTQAPSIDPKLLSRPVAADALALGVSRVVLDAGHGGEHLGAIGRDGLHEKDLTLDLAHRVRELLLERGVGVVMTRTGDQTLSLKQRAETANAGRGDIFVSIHLNSLKPSWVRGVETFYLGPGDQPEQDEMAARENEHSGYSLADMRMLLDRIYADARRNESKRLAESVQRALVARLRTVDPELPDRGVKTAPFIVLVATEMPAILAEVSALSNPREAARLATPGYRQTIAEALVEGIGQFIDHKDHPAERKHPSES